MYVAVTKSQICLSQERNRECTWANSVGGTRWDRVRKLFPMLAFGQLLSEICQHVNLSGYDLLFCGRHDWCLLKCQIFAKG